MTRPPRVWLVVTPRHVLEQDRADVELRERLLLYVACTRARDRLVITWAGKPSRVPPEAGNA